MGAQRDIKLDEYEISKAAFRELKYFCQQYWEKKAKLQAIRSIHAPSGGPVVSGGETGRPTESKAMKAERLAADVNLIETTAEEAGGDISQWLLAVVTVEGATYNTVRPPIGVNQFNRIRRKFYFMLALKKGIA